MIGQYLLVGMLPRLHPVILSKLIRRRDDAEFHRVISHRPHYDADDDELHTNGADSDSFLGENDVHPNLPRNLRQRLRRLKVSVYDHGDYPY